MSAQNKVIAGDYENKKVQESFGTLKITSLTEERVIDKKTVETYEVITDEMRKSGTSAILRGGLGSLVFGPVGVLAGLTAKNKGTYQVAVQFRDGKKSLLELDEKLYKLLIKKCF